MTPDTAVDVFSAFVMELHERSLSHDPLALFRWGMADLARILGSDCAWGGWADLRREEIELCASLSHNLPPDFDDFWTDIRHEDLLARDIMQTGRDAAFYDRRGSRHTDGMIALSDRYHIDKMAVVAADQPDSSVSIFISCYRSGAQARAIEAEETKFLRNALDHIRYLALRRPRGPEDANLLVNARGRILSASPGAHRFIRRRWRGWSGEYLPVELVSPSSPLLSRRLSELDAAVDRRELSHRPGQSLFGITLRSPNPCDSLTARERQITEEIAQGRTHKEIARRLELSPATVRNHTQTILRKLDVRNKGALARMIHEARPN